MRLSGIAQERAGVPKIRVDMAVDGSGIVTVFAFDLATKASVRSVLEKKGLLSPEQLRETIARAKVAFGEAESRKRVKI